MPPDAKVIGGTWAKTNSEPDGRRSFGRQPLLR
jgi:hypothetical protein